MLLDTSFFARGMNNMYNAVTFIADVHCVRREDLSRWETQFSISDYYLFSVPMQYMIENYMLGGYMMT